jgi:hypothetical protein
MTAHVCDTGEQDRTLCPEPCGTGHVYCTVCGERQDQCALDGVETVDFFAANRIARRASIWD